jgi:hypothetical protein
MRSLKLTSGRQLARDIFELEMNILFNYSRPCLNCYPGTFNPATVAGRSASL